MLHHPLCETSVRNGVRASFLTFHNANKKSVQELRLLLGIYCLCCVPREPPIVYVPILTSGVHRIRSIFGNYFSLLLRTIESIAGQFNRNIKITLQLCELGNLATHLALRNLRPPGTNVRKIPVPDWNPLTQLFKWVHFKIGINFLNQIAWSLNQFI